MDRIQIAYTVLGSLGLILATLGYLIKYKKMINLVAGVCKNDKRIKNKIGFARFVGGNVMALGIVFFIGSLMIYSNYQHKILIETFFLVGVFMVISITFRNAKKYINQEENHEK
ncbi:MAG: DUF3784 domain-containing protein [Candidatus Omnitrophica bacterium]|nr:DUF3784 domain-containing protein [Candidatus Omnitrophota bacterium]